MQVQTTIKPLPLLSHIAGMVLVLLLTIPVQAQLAAPNEAGVTFSHVHLSVTDVELHGHLWKQLFGGEVVEKAGYTAIRLPGALIFLTEKEPTAPSTDTAIDHFGITVHNLAAILTRWHALGYEADSVSKATDPLRTYLTLPDGVRLTLVEDPDLSMPAKMSHLHFFATQPDALKDWYIDLFGAVPLPNNTTEKAAHIPGSALYFTRATEDRIPTEDTAIDHIGFEVEDFHPFVDKLKNRGVTFVFGPRYIESLDLWVAFFPDPSGVVVEISEGLDSF